MNDKIKAILIKIVLELKKLKWTLGPDYDIELQSANKIPLRKNIGDIETHIDVSLESDDNITFYPAFNIMGEIFIDGGPIKDIENSLDASVSFMETDANNTTKILQAAKEININSIDYVQEESNNYNSMNASDIERYKSGGWKADID